MQYKRAKARELAARQAYIAALELKTEAKARRDAARAKKKAARAAIEEHRKLFEHRAQFMIRMKREARLRSGILSELQAYVNLVKTDSIAARPVQSLPHWLTAAATTLSGESFYFSVL